MFLKSVYHNIKMENFKSEKDIVKNFKFRPINLL